jgi:CSLREA domain-containing protein
MNSREGLLLRATAKHNCLRALATLAAVMAASLLLLLVGPELPPAHAATPITVNTAADETTLNDGLCSLREAIQNADDNDAFTFPECQGGSGADTILFNLGPSATITLGSPPPPATPLPDITDDAGLTIDGGNNAITVSGGGNTQVFSVCGCGDLTLTNLTVADGKATTPEPSGAGIYNEGGTVTVTNSTFSGNSAGDSGGAIFNESGSTLRVTNSTFSGNSAGDSGGGIYNGGTLTVTNSTFSGNSASTQGGAILNAFDWTLRNTILANSPSGGNCFNSGNLLIDGGYNIEFFPGNTCSFNASTSKSNTDPQFAGGLANNGGPTQTIALQPTSPAVDAIPPAGGCEVGITTDQRGVSRPQGAGCDIGAFELVPTPPTPPTPPQPPGPQPGPQPNPHHKHKHHHGHHGGHHHKHKGGGHGGNGGGGGGISRGGGQGIG